MCCSRDPGVLSIWICEKEEVDVIKLMQKVKVLKLCIINEIYLNVQRKVDCQLSSVNNLYLFVKIQSSREESLPVVRLKRSVKRPGASYEYTVKKGYNYYGMHDMNEFKW